MTYTPDPTDGGNPVGSTPASTAAAEFEALKTYIQQLLGNPPSGTYRQNILSAMFQAGDIFYSANPTRTGVLVCDGSAVSRVTYATLFAAIGTVYGAGDGSTTFNLPQLLSTFIRGQHTGGITGGADSISIAATNIPNHTHTATAVVTDPGHLHVLVDPSHNHSYTASHSTAGPGAGASNPGWADSLTTTTSASTGITMNSNTTGISATISVNSQGNGTAFNIVPAWVSAIPYIKY